MLTPPPDLRDPTTIPLNFTKSINLALSERGTVAIKESGAAGVLDQILSEALPMRGRMVHTRGRNGSLVEGSQDYDIHGRVSGLPQMYHRGWPC